MTDYQDGEHIVVKRPASRHEESALITRAKDGDKQAFEALLGSYRNGVYGIIFQFLGNAKEAEEIFWEVWSNVYFSLNKFHEKSSFSTWIYGIAINVIKHSKRRFARKESRFVPLPDSLASPDNPVRAVERNERNALLSKAIQALPEDFRKPLVLHTISGLSYEEISAILKVSPGALKTRVWRAKQILQETLRPWLTS